MIGFLKIYFQDFLAENGINSSIKQYKPKQLIFLISLLRDQREKLELKSRDAPQRGELRDYYEHLDYALIKAMIISGAFKDMESFFRDTVPIHIPAIIVSTITELIKVVENGVKNDPGLVDRLSAYIYQLGRSKKALNIWKKVASTGYDTDYVCNYVSGILQEIYLKCRQSSPLVFHNLFKKHVDWIANSTAALDKLFDSLGNNEDGPIEDAIEGLINAQNTQKIKESFLRSWIYTHRSRRQDHHTKLALLYLGNFFVHHQTRYFSLFDKHIKDEQILSDERPLIKQIEEYR